MRRNNNTALDGTTISVTIGRTEAPCTKSSYADGLETQTLSNMGSQKIDYRTRGTYKTEEGSFSMESSTFRAEIMPLFQQNGFGNEKLPLVFNYEHPDLGDDSDLCDACRIVNLAAAIENSAKAFEVELKFVTDQIYWGDDRKTINAIDPTIPLGASKF